MNKRGELLKRLRAESGLTLKEVAGRIGVDHTTIWKYENDKIKMNSDTLEMLAELYHIEAGDLLEVKDNVTSDPFVALKAAVIKTKNVTGISKYDNLPDEVKSMLLGMSMEALRLLYNSFQANQDNH